MADEVEKRMAEMRKAFETSSTDEENRLRERVSELQLALTRIMAFNPGEFRGLQDEIAIWRIAKEALGL